MSGDDIIDAEWDEVPEERPVHEPVRLPHQRPGPSRQPPPPEPESASSPWQNRAFWHETVGTILTVVGRIGVIALGLLVLFFLAIAWADHRSSGDSGLDETAAAGQSPAEQSMNAEQMLAAWSQAVTGRADTSGLTLASGSGKSGDFCNNANGDTLLKFGGDQVAGAEVYDFFAEYHATTNSGTVGAFWYDRNDGSLVTRNKAVVDSEVGRGKSVPDRVHEFDTDGRGHVTIDGTAYRVCTL